ncbi:MAG: hypothetical protein NZP72_09305 [Geminicoccaceae bacterium]|nr:hypothetical protein [Geminicoccaceae bacterium]
MMRALPAIVLLVLAVSGCRTIAELEQAAREARAADCKAAGFVEGTDPFRLCLMIRETNERIERVERRIDFLDTEISRAVTFGFWRRWP